MLVFFFELYWCTMMTTLLFFIQAIAEARTDRHALPEFRQKFLQDVARLPGMLMRNSDRAASSLCKHEQLKLQAVCAVSVASPCIVLKSSFWCAHVQQF